MQQAEARAAGLEKFAAYADNPAAFAYDCFADPDSPSGRLELAPHQIDVMQRVAAGRDVTWRAGHGVGKTTTLAILVFYYLCIRPVSKVPTTAPTQRQVRNLWDEIGKWFERFRFRSFFNPGKTRLEMKARPSEWFAIGMSSNRQENIEGFHAKRLLYLVDEAKGVADPIYDGIDGACTEGGQRMYVSTPGSRLGKFYQSHHGRISHFFDVVHTNGETAPRVSRSWVEKKRAEWGEDSSIYIAKVRGEFPQEGDDVLYPLDFIDEANRAFLEQDEEGTPAVKHGAHPIIGCDVARFGFNKTVAVGGTASRFDRLSWWERKPTTETSATLIAMTRDMEAAGQRVQLVAVDDSGLGGGVTDQLTEARIPVEGVLFGASPTEAGREYFANKKAEMAHGFRVALDANRKARLEGKPGTFALLPNDRLLGQLSAMRRRYGGRGVLSIVDPDDPTIPATELAPGMKVSPDHAHAAILAYYASTQAISVTVGAVVQPPSSPRTTLTRQRLSGYIFGRRPR